MFHDRRIAPRPGHSVLLVPHRREESLPVHLASLHARIDQILRNPALAQFVNDALRAEAPSGPALDIGLGVTSIALQTTALQILEDRGDGGRIMPSRLQFLQDLLAGVLAPRQQLQYRFSDCLPGPTQTSASAGVASEADAGRATARMAASISRLISGCSLRNTRTLSLPWPIRSSL